MKEFILSLLNCWHQDKVRLYYLSSFYLGHKISQTSIQDLVKAVISACTSHISEECLYTDASPLTPDKFNQLIRTITDGFPACMTSDSILSRAKKVASLRTERMEQLYDSVVGNFVRTFGWNG